MVLGASVGDIDGLLICLGGRCLPGTLTLFGLCPCLGLCVRLCLSLSLRLCLSLLAGKLLCGCLVYVNGDNDFFTNKLGLPLIDGRLWLAIILAAFAVLWALAVGKATKAISKLINKRI